MIYKCPEDIDLNSNIRHIYCLFSETRVRPTIKSHKAKELEIRSDQRGCLHMDLTAVAMDLVAAGVLDMAAAAGVLDLAAAEGVLDLSAA